MAENATPQKPIEDPYADAQKASEQFASLRDMVQNQPEEAQKLGIGVAGMRRGPPPEPEPLSKSIQGEVNLSHVIDGIGRIEMQNQQILNLLRNQSGARF